MERRTFTVGEQPEKDGRVKVVGNVTLSAAIEPAGFRPDLGLKDNRLVLDAPRDAEAPMPLASMVREPSLSDVARRWGDRDGAGPAERLARRAGRGEYIPTPKTTRVEGDGGRTSGKRGTSSLGSGLACPQQTVDQQRGVLGLPATQFPDLLATGGALGDQVRPPGGLLDGGNEASFGHRL